MRGLILGFAGLSLFLPALSMGGDMETTETETLLYQVETRQYGNSRYVYEVAVRKDLLIPVLEKSIGGAEIHSLEASNIHSSSLTLNMNLDIDGSNYDISCRLSVRQKDVYGQGLRKSLKIGDCSRKRPFPFSILPSPLNLAPTLLRIEEDRRGPGDYGEGLLVGIWNKNYKCRDKIFSGNCRKWLLKSIYVKKFDAPYTVLD